MIHGDDLKGFLPREREERTRLLGRENVDPSGAYVLYWMRTAIRVEENQALNATIEFSNRLAVALVAACPHDASLTT